MMIPAADCSLILFDIAQMYIERELLSYLLEVLNCEGETHGQHKEAQTISEEVTSEPQQGRWLADAQGSAQAHLARSLPHQLSWILLGECFDHSCMLESKTGSNTPSY